MAVRGRFHNAVVLLIAGALLCPAADPLPVSAIPERLESAAALVRASNVAATPGSEQDVARDFPSFATNIRAMIKLTSADVQSGQTLSQLRDALDNWGVVKSKLTGWQTLLKGRVEELSTNLQALDAEHSFWATTLGSTATLRLPADLESSVSSTATALEDAQKASLSRRDAILDQQTRLAQLQIEVDALTEQVESAADRRGKSLETFDSPPLWALSSGQVSQAGPVSEFAQIVEQHPSVLTFYAADVLLHLTLVVTVFLVILITLLLLRRRDRPDPQDPDDSIRALAFVFRRPYSTALLLAIAFSTIVRLDYPVALVSLGWYLLLIPLLRLLPGVLPGRLTYPFWLLALFFLTDRILMLVSRHAFGVRIATLALAIATLTSLLWLYRRMHFTDIEGVWGAVIRAGVWAAVLTLAASATSNVIGMFALSRFLMSATLRCVYAAVLLHGAVVVVRGLLGRALRSRGARYVIPHGEDFEVHQRRLKQVVRVIGALIFTGVALRAFALWDPLLTAIDDFLDTQHAVGAVHFTYGDLTTIAVVLVLAYVVSQVIRFLSEVAIYPRLNLQLGAARATSKVIHYLIMLVGFLCAVAAAGIDITKLVVFFSALGVGIGFGLQNIVNNFVSGLVLLFERPLQVGDNVLVGDTAGVVSDIGIRASKIRTWEGADVLIPNGQLVSQGFTNWTLSDPRRREDLRFGVAYGTPPEEVMDLACQVALADPRVIREPAPYVLLTDFGDSSMNYALRYWCTVADHVTLTSSLRVKLVAALDKAGIEMPFPQRDLNIRAVAPEALDAMRPKSEAPQT
jgi:potassium-dependent mechanosensitive channel